jgi:hypothetical protein
MRLKLLFSLGIATGYVLGAKAGRLRYETIKAKATQTWEDPRVQRIVSDAGEFVKDAAPVVEARVSEATAAAVSGVKVATRKVSEVADATSGNARVAAEKVAETAASLRERILEAVDTLVEKSGAARDRSGDEPVPEKFVTGEPAADEPVANDGEPKPLL